MKHGQQCLRVCLVLVCGFVACQFCSAQTTPPKIDVRLSLPSREVQRGRNVAGSLVIDIPSGYHVNAHEPLSRFALPTRIDVEAPTGIRVRQITYPKAVVRKFDFSNDRLGVYEHRAEIRFKIFVPLNQTLQKGEVKARLYYQSCSDEVCFPPMKREVTVAFTVR